MVNVSITTIITAPTEKIWNTIRSFRGVENYVPLVKSSIVEGSGEGAKRTCSVQIGDQEVKLIERIDMLNDEEKSIKYSIIESPSPFQGIQMQIQVKSLAENQSELQISSETQQETAKMMQDVLQMMGDGLKKLHEK